MAYKKKTYKRRPKKTGKRHYKRRNFPLIKTVSTGAVTGFPDRMLMKHRYCEQIALTYTIGSPTTYVFSCNGLFDPNVTGTGHQPYYFDQMSALYNHYTVLGSKIRVMGGSPAPSAGVSSYVALLREDDAGTGYANITSIIENGIYKNQWKITGGINPSKVTLTNTWSAKKVFGPAASNNTDLTGSGVANPLEQSFWNIVLEASDRSTTVLFNAMVEIDYIVMWKEKKNISPS